MYKPYRVALLLLIVLFTLPALAQTDDNTLRFGHPFRSGDLDPIQEGDDGELVFFDLIFDTLLTLDADGNLQPRLATDWTFTADTLDFTLREDVVFSDGTPFDASVAVANLERALSDGARSTQTTLRAVTGVEALDTYTLRVTHDGTDRFIERAFTTYPAMMVSPNAFDTVANMPIGSGPYVLDFEETVPGSVYVYERNPLFWDADSIAVDRVEMRVIALPDLGNGLLAGDLDVILVTDGFTRTLPTDGYTVLTAETALYALAFWDREGALVPELADPAVRCALSQAIDADLYNQAVTGVALNTIQSIPPATWYGASGVTKPAYDPEAARAALEATGAADLTLPLTAFPAVRLNHEALVGFLSEVGVTVETVLRENSEVYPYILAGNSPAGYINMNTLHFADFVETHVLATGTWNPLNTVDDDIAALAQAARTLPLAEAEPLYTEISRLINERCYFVPLSVGSVALYLSPDVVGAEGRYRTNGFVNLRNVSLERDS